MFVKGIRARNISRNLFFPCGMYIRKMDRKVFCVIDSIMTLCKLAAYCDRMQKKGIVQHDVQLIGSN